MRACSSGVRACGIYHRPDAPPPPKEPPPPEKPPPNPPPEPEDHPPPPQPPPDDQPPPPGNIHPPHAERRRRRRALRYISSQMPKKIATGRKLPKPSSAVGRGRAAARFLNSSASPDSTCTMSSTPRSIPPGTSLARKRGRMEFSIISFDTASVSLPSSP